ncbi:hypothetical protein [Myceligenerans xiligouense]|nr:hypothetical protein [Myceligenerans xiligouense]
MVDRVRGQSALIPLTGLFSHGASANVVNSTTFSVATSHRA